jgi:hypothetical protein
MRITSLSTLSYVKLYQEKNTLLRKNFFSFSAATMVLSGFGPYHALWHKDAPSKCIDVTPKSRGMIQVLGLE